MKNKNFNQEEIVNHLKTYGFVFQSSEIYGGLSNSWDMGPLGAMIKNNLKNLFINYFVHSQPNMCLIDSNIILNPLVWKASGHLSNFSDPLIDCKKCKERFRADKLIEANTNEKVNESMNYDVLEKIIENHKIVCPNCKSFDWTKIRNFNLLFETKLGVVEEDKNTLFLRPETAQGIFINFKNVQRTTRMKIPFGIAQIGKSFRNEITPGNFIFRTREFEQMEIEFFVKEEDSKKYFDKFLKSIKDFLFKELNIKKKNISIVDYPKEELAHYSKRTVDFFYNFPHGQSELWGLADRGNFDLSQHIEYSKKNLFYQDELSNQKIIPCVIEPSVGVERLLYAILCDAYDVDKINNEDRIVLRLNPKISPYLIAILPLNNKLNKKANKLFSFFLERNISVTFDTSGSIGKRYRRQDAIGTPFCITYDFDSNSDNKFTLRHRDSAKQEEQRMTKEEIVHFILKNKIGNNVDE